MAPEDFCGRKNLCAEVRSFLSNHQTGRTRTGEGIGGKPGRIKSSLTNLLDGERWEDVRATSRKGAVNESELLTPPREDERRSGRYTTRYPESAACEVPAEWRNRGKVCEEQSGNEGQEDRRGIVLVRNRPSSSEQDRRVRCLETRTPQTWCRRAAEKVTRHSKGECRYFSAVRDKRLVRRDKADRHNAEDPEMGKTEFLGAATRDVRMDYKNPSLQKHFGVPDGTFAISPGVQKTAFS